MRNPIIFILSISIFFTISAFGHVRKHTSNKITGDHVVLVFFGLIILFVLVCLIIRFVSFLLGGLSKDGSKVKVSSESKGNKVEDDKAKVNSIDDNPFTSSPGLTLRSPVESSPVFDIEKINLHREICELKLSILRERMGFEEKVKNLEKQIKEASEKKNRKLSRSSLSYTLTHSSLKKTVKQRLYIREVNNDYDGLQREVDAYLRFVYLSDPVKAGEVYERYVGYCLEASGFKVHYHGIVCQWYNSDDEGIDLIAWKASDGNLSQLRLCQCKRLKSAITRDELGIFFSNYHSVHWQQLRSCEAEYYYYSTSNGTQTAWDRSYAHGITLVAEFKLKRYPCIKCFVDDNGLKGFSIPTDFFYDRIVMGGRSTGFYVSSVEEAVKQGFSRICEIDIDGGLDRLFY